MKKVRLLAVLAIGLMSVMSVKAQSKRMLEFQVMMSMHDITYKNFIKDETQRSDCPANNVNKHT